MARLAGCRVDPDRATYILNTFACPEPLEPLRQEVEGWLERIRHEEEDTLGAFPSANRGGKKRQ